MNGLRSLHISEIFRKLKIMILAFHITLTSTLNINCGLGVR